MRRQRVVNGASVCFDEGRFGGRTLEETPVLLEEALGEAYEAGEASGSTPEGPGGPPGEATPPAGTQSALEAANDVEDRSGSRLMAADDVLMLPGDVPEELETNDLASLAPGEGFSAVLWDAKQVPSQIPRRSQRILARPPPRVSHCMASRASAREEPQTLSDPLDRDPVEWRNAIEDEHQSHIENGT